VRQQKAEELLFYTDLANPEPLSALPVRPKQYNFLVLTDDIDTIEWYFPEFLQENPVKGFCVMGELIKAAFGTKVTPKLRHYDPTNTRRQYQAEIFCELYPNFPQYKQHVAAFVERNYCTMINDEDHPTPQDVLQFLKPDEVIRLNEWILTRGPNLHQSLGE
jgi:hypothetical protein